MLSAGFSKQWSFFLPLGRSNKGRTPAPSRHPSAPSFDTQKQQLGSLLVAAPSKHDAKARVRQSVSIQFLVSDWVQALERDGYRCLFSGKLDIPSIAGGLVPDDGGDLAVTQAAHIFNQSTNQGLEDENKVFNPSQ